jgi:heme/copper-type cytochrome/quinol oxidase subunit 2
VREWFIISFCMFANSTLAFLYEVHRFTMVMEVLALGLVCYIILIILYDVSSWLVSQVSWGNRHLQLELAWTAVPACMIICLINLGILSGYATADITPAVSTHDVIGFQWYWSMSKVDVCMVASSLLNVGELRLLEVSS